MVSFSLRQRILFPLFKDTRSVSFHLSQFGYPPYPRFEIASANLGADAEADQAPGTSRFVGGI